MRFGFEGYHSPLRFDVSSSGLWARCDVEEGFIDQDFRVCGDARDDYGSEMEVNSSMEARARARRFSEAEEGDMERPRAESDRGHWLMSCVNNAGIPRLPYVIHTCGIMRRQVPNSEFLTFYWGHDNGRALGQRERTTIELGLVVWLSLPRFGPRE